MLACTFVQGIDFDAAGLASTHNGLGNDRCPGQLANRACGRQKRRGHRSLWEGLQGLSPAPSVLFAWARLVHPTRLPRSLPVLRVSFSRTGQAACSGIKKTYGPAGYGPCRMVSCALRILSRLGQHVPAPQRTATAVPFPVLVGYLGCSRDPAVPSELGSVAQYHGRLTTQRNPMWLADVSTGCAWRAAGR